MGKGILNVRHFTKMRRESKQTIVVFRKHGEFVSDLLGKSFAVVNDFIRVIRIGTLFRQ